MGLDGTGVSLEYVWEAIVPIAKSTSSAEDMVSGVADVYGVSTETIHAWLALLADELELQQDRENHIWELAQSEAVPITEPELLWEQVCRLAPRCTTGRELADLVMREFAVSRHTAEATLASLVAHYRIADEEGEAEAASETVLEYLHNHYRSELWPAEIYERVAGNLSDRDLVRFASVDRLAHQYLHRAVDLRRDETVCPACRPHQYEERPGPSASHCVSCEQPLRKSDLVVFGIDRVAEFSCSHLLHLHCAKKLLGDEPRMHIAVHGVSRSVAIDYSRDELKSADVGQILVWGISGDVLLIVGDEAATRHPTVRSIFGRRGTLFGELSVQSRGHFKAGGFRGHTAGQVRVWLQQDSSANRLRFNEMFKKISGKSVEFCVRRMSKEE